jgi:hypothetical protein
LVHGGFWKRERIYKEEDIEMDETALEWA